MIQYDKNSTELRQHKTSNLENMTYSTRSSIETTSTTRPSSVTNEAQNSENFGEKPSKVKDTEHNSIVDQWWFYLIIFLVIMIIALVLISIRKPADGEEEVPLLS